MTADPSSRTAAALAARRRGTEVKLDQVRAALTRLRREHSDVTFPTQDNRILDERLHAARSNLRFQDRRISDLEAKVLEHPT